MGAESSHALCEEFKRRPSLFRRARERAENAFWTACVGLVLLRLVSKGK
jgi:hypothetical protein